MIDQEIGDALKVDPSPEFMARVRTRIANEPAPSAWRWSLTFAAGGALAAAVIVAAIWSPIQRRPDPSGPGSQAKASASAGPKGPALQPAKPDNSLTERRPDRVSDVRRPGPFGPGRTRESRDAAGPEGPALHEKPAVAAHQTEILFDHSEMRALQGLIAAARNGSIALTPAGAAAPPAPMELEPVTDLVIPPIPVEPIAPISGTEGVRP
jgi:hypothetical protein